MPLGSFRVGVEEIYGRAKKLPERQDENHVHVRWYPSGIQSIEGGMLSWNLWSIGKWEGSENLAIW